MDSASIILHYLARVPQFAGLDEGGIARLCGLTALRVLAKGEFAVLADDVPDELGIVLSGRLAEQGKEPDAQEFGRGTAPAAQSFFSRRPLPASLIALRETVLITLSWSDLVAAFNADPAFLEAYFASLARSDPGFAQAPGPNRLVLCPAGSKTQIDAAIKTALMSSLESLGEVRLLRRESFGSLALDAPDTAHWLQEQELEFDVTAVLADTGDARFVQSAIEEGDEIIFVAAGGSASLSALESDAMQKRGAARCRLVIAKDSAPKNAADWIAPRPYRSTQSLDFSSEKETVLLASLLLGKGISVAATSSGVYAAAILGALQALEASGLPPACLVAAGSAILPAGLLAAGVSLADTEEAFRRLAEPAAWKKAARPDAGLFEAAILDAQLAEALPDLEIGLSTRPFIAVSHSLSENAARTHQQGRFRNAVRAGLTPPGILPPFIADDGDILISGLNETESVAAAGAALSACPLMFLSAQPASPGKAAMSYRQLAGPAFRLTPFQTAAAPEKRLRLESVLGTLPFRAQPALWTSGPNSFAIPIAEGISPMDWPEWEWLRDAAFEWTSLELETRGLEHVPI